MRLGDLAPAPGAKKTEKRVGRGSGSGLGKTAGKGHKGQKARAGAKHPAWFEGGQMPMQRRLPKRGFKNPFRVEYAVVNVGDLARFEAGSAVGIEELRASGLVKKLHGGVKLLAGGDLASPLTLTVHQASAAAIEKVKAAGGTVELIVKGN